MTKIAGSGSASGSISQRYGSAGPDPDPDPPQNVMDPQHCSQDPLAESEAADQMDRSAHTSFSVSVWIRLAIGLVVRIFRIFSRKDPYSFESLDPDPYSEYGSGSRC
jgi:hypothetical protein